MLRRNRNDIGDVQTRSLTLHHDLLAELERRTLMRDDRNMSALIEEEVTESIKKGYKIEAVPIRRKRGTFPAKKTFTFTHKFWNQIIKSGNASLYIEKLLSEKYSITLD